MCLSNIYRASDRKLLMDNTAKIEVRPDQSLEFFKAVSSLFPGRVLPALLYENILIHPGK